MGYPQALTTRRLPNASLFGYWAWGLGFRVLEFIGVWGFKVELGFRV